MLKYGINIKKIINKLKYIFSIRQIMKIFETILQYFLSYFTVMMVLVYILNLPQLVTNDKKGLIKEYYYDNFSNVVVFDFFLIIIYLALSLFFIKLLKSDTLTYNTIIVILTTILISGIFALYFLNTPENETFFSRWFHSVHYLAIVYDIIIVTSVYLLFYFIKNKI